jgi:hypothetical protein
MTQRGDGVRTHRELLFWIRLTTPRSSRQGAPAAIDDLYPVTAPAHKPPASEDYWKAREMEISACRLIQFH